MSGSCLSGTTVPGLRTLDCLTINYKQIKGWFIIFSIEMKLKLVTIIRAHASEYQRNPVAALFQ